MIFSFILYFFFFKQKTAYEIRLSLVGSEMCIRDSYGLLGYQSVIDALKANGVKLHLGIFMQESSENLNAVFSNAATRR